MSLCKYIKDKKTYILFSIIYLTILILLLNMTGVSIQGIVAVCTLYVNATFIPLTIEYVKKKSHYDNIYKTLVSLDKKTLLCEIINSDSFTESEILYDILMQVSKSMNDEIGVYKKQASDYMEYINMWVHEIKTPIAAGKLISRNNNTVYSKSVIEELDKIEGYIQQVLYYSKSFNVSDDYSISKIGIESLVNNAIKKNSKVMIKSKVKVEKNGLNDYIYTDIKWLTFILSQIIMNAITYMDKDDKKIVFSSHTNADNVVLSIKDNGIGISEVEIDRIFDKGFVGENGRLIGKSTGFGLYICRKLCSNLHIGITANSKKDEYTEIILTFPKSKII